MQSYGKNHETYFPAGEISAYLLLKLNLYQVELISKCGLSTDDVRYIQMYEEYLSLRAEGVPKERIYQYCERKYHVSKSTAKRVVKRFSQRVTP